MGADQYFPRALLWGDEAAHKLRAEWNSLSEVYAIRDEINLLSRWAEEVTQHLHEDSVPIDLSCGYV
jgi:hypothetical protein